jgi:four helix bundle protein
MAGYHTLRVYHDAQSQLATIAIITESIRFGDLANQLRRAAISVVSNIVEGSSRYSDREFIRYLIIARSSNSEIAAQLTMAQAICQLDLHDVLNHNQRVGRQLSGLIRSLRGPP